MGRFLFTGFILFLLITLLRATPESDEIPGFFLKITKNVPRIGRRSDNFFFKNMKSIPRVGRSDGTTDLQLWLNDDTQYVDKRRLLNSNAANVMVEREYSVVQPVNSNTLIQLLEKDAIPTDNVKFVHWKDFDRALQLDMELYMKVMSLGRAPDQRLREDLNLRMGSFTPLYENDNMENSNANFVPFQRVTTADESFANKYNDNFMHYNHL